MRGSGGGLSPRLKLRLETADVASTTAFYRDVLGLEVVDRWAEENDSGVIFSLPDTGGAWPIDGPHRRPWGSLYAYLRDPSGVPVVVYESPSHHTGRSS